VRGTAAALSFFPAKNLGCFGDGGAVLTDDEALADRIATLRVHGARPKYYHRMIGGNFRLDALQAAILAVKLPHLRAAIERRRRAAAVYRQLFGERQLPIGLPVDRPEHTYNQFVIRTPRRDQLRDYLATREIATAVYYPVPLHLQTCFAMLGYREGQLPEAERAAREVLALPISPTITPAQQAEVVAAITAFCDSSGH
jgi:dTDP-4-amino-4,6-dideoxygalactose transaminase